MAALLGRVLNLRFTLLQLCLICPAFAIAWWVASGPHGLRESCKSTIAVNDVRRIRRAIEFDETIRIPITRESLSSKFGSQRDPWGNAFQFVQLVSGADSTSGDPFYVYSCGEDGISASHGSDVDDTNSWNFDYDKHYGPRNRASYRRRCNEMTMKKTLWVFPFIYVCLTIGCLVLQRFRSQLSRTIQLD